MNEGNDFERAKPASDSYFLGEIKTSKSGSDSESLPSPVKEEDAKSLKAEMTTAQESSETNQIEEIETQSMEGDLKPVNETEDTMKAIMKSNGFNFSENDSVESDSSEFEEIESVRETNFDGKENQEELINFEDINQLNEKVDIEEETESQSLSIEIVETIDEMLQIETETAESKIFVSLEEPVSAEVSWSENDNDSKGDDKVEKTNYDGEVISMEEDIGHCFVEMPENEGSSDVFFEAIVAVPERDGFIGIFLLGMSAFAVFSILFYIGFC